MKIAAVMVALVLAWAVPAQAETAPVKDVLYGPSEYENGTVLACATTGCPVVAFVHGGWCEEQKGAGEEESNHVSPEMDPVQMLRLQEQKMMVYDIDYPQMTRTVSAFPTEPRAVENAVVWLSHNAQRYGGDPSKIVLWGSSCGGYVATNAAEFLARDYPGLLKGVSAWSAPWMRIPGPNGFIEELRNGETAASGNGPTVELASCHAGVNKLYEDCKQAVEEEVSPILHLPTANCPPMQIMWGEVNDLVDNQQSKEEANAAQAAGCEVERSPAHGGHAISYFSTKKPALVAFVRRVVQR